MNNQPKNPNSSASGQLRLLLTTAVVAALAAAGGAALLVNILEHKQEARNPFYRVVELNDEIGRAHV